MLKTNEEYLDHIKLVGEYNLKDTYKWREKAIYFEKHGYYCPHIEGTVDYINFWEDEKNKCINGVFIDDFYIPGIYYFYLNYLPIFRKQDSKYDFPDVYDMDYHTFLCLEHAEFLGVDFAVVKKRQAGFTLKFLAVLIRELWFGFGSPLYYATYEDAQVRKGWNDVLEPYKSHLNEHTGWYRDFTPDKTLDWRVAKEIITPEGRKITKGRKNTLKGLILSKSPSKGVGGGAKWIFADESGVNPVLDKFLGYINPMIKYGTKKTGTVIVSGAVGELKQSAALKELILNPKANGYYYVDNIWDEDRLNTQCGFFVPASWSLHGEDEAGVPFIDEHGNSDVKRSTEYLLRQREKLKQISIEKYLFAISQDPLTIKECFQHRDDDIFSQELISQQMFKLELKDHDGTFVDLYRDKDGKIRHKLLRYGEARFVNEFPVKAKSNKEGNIQILEFPMESPPYGLYWAGVDITRENESNSSPSLNTIYIYKSSHNLESELKAQQMVAVYTSRPKDKMIWFEKAMLLLEYYNAECLAENNVYWFIEEAIKMKKQYLIAKTPGWVKDINPNSKNLKAYGVNMTTKLMDELVGKIKSYSEEIYYTEFNDDTGEPIHHYGIERIKDRMLLIEMSQYRPKSVDKTGNYDRIIAFGLALMHSDYNVTRGVILEENNNNNYNFNIKNAKLQLRNSFTKRRYRIQ